MAKSCQITGKKVIVGNNVSHANNRTKRRFHANLQKKKFFLPGENKWVELTVSAAGMRTINKKGIELAIAEAKEKGFF